MSEFDPARLDAAVAEFRAASAPHIRPVGFDLACATVRRRRRARVVGAGVVAFVLAIALLSAYTGLVHRPGPHAPVPGGNWPVVVPTLTPDPSRGVLPPVSTPASEPVGPSLDPPSVNPPPSSTGSP